MAHIHRGTADVAGPIVVWLGGPPPPGADNFSDTGCATGVDPNLIKEIRQNRKLSMSISTMPITRVARSGDS